MAPGITGGFLAGRNLSRKWLGNKTEGRNSTDKAGSVTKASLEQQINDMPKSLFRPGQNCSEVARAGRVAFIVDAEDYFRAFMHACERAERSILILAWDFDSRMVLCHDEGKQPIVLGDFLNGLAKSNRNLRIRILDWDYPMVYGTDREILADARPHLEAAPAHRLPLRRHAPGRGLAPPEDRGDRRQPRVLGRPGPHQQALGHARAQGRRPAAHFDGEPYPPFHDVMIAVDGEAAKALARIARERWRAATGEI